MPDSTMKAKPTDSTMKARPSSLALSLYVTGIVTLLMVIISQIYVEWTQAALSKKFNPLRKYVPVSCDPDPSNHGKIIHIDCPIENMSTFYPPSEFWNNLSSVHSLFLDTKVEMYQWSTSYKRLDVGYAKQWSENRETARDGILTTRRNPNYWPSVTGNGRQFPARLFAGGFELDPTVISSFTHSSQVPLAADAYYSASPVRPPQSISSANTHEHHGYLYTGDWDTPMVGDMRISFYGSDATHVSAIGQQECRHGKCYIVPVNSAISTDEGLSRAKGWASRDSAVDPEDRMAVAINLAKKSFDWAYNTGADAIYTKPRIMNMDSEVIIVREGDHTGYRLLYDAVSGGKLQKTKRWLFRFLSFAVSSLVGAYSYGLIHPSKGFSTDVPTANQIMWLALGGSGCGVFAASLVTSTVWLSTDKWMAFFFAILALSGLALAVFVGEMALEPMTPETPVVKATTDRYEYIQLTQDPAHNSTPSYYRHTYSPSHTPTVYPNTYHNTYHNTYPNTYHNTYPNTYPNTYHTPSNSLRTPLPSIAPRPRSNAAAEHSEDSSYYSPL